MCISIWGNWKVFVNLNLKLPGLINNFNLLSNNSYSKISSIKYVTFFSLMLGWSYSRFSAWLG